MNESLPLLHFTHDKDFAVRTDRIIEMDGLQIPKTIKAIWELEVGSLEYFKAEIGDYHISKSIP